MQNICQEWFKSYVELYKSEIIKQEMKERQLIPVLICLQEEEEKEKGSRQNICQEWLKLWWSFQPVNNSSALVFQEERGRGIKVKEIEKAMQLIPRFQKFVILQEEEKCRQNICQEWFESYAELHISEIVKQEMKERQLIPVLICLQEEEKKEKESRQIISKEWIKELKDNICSREEWDMILVSWGKNICESQKIEDICDFFGITEYSLCVDILRVCDEDIRKRSSIEAWKDSLLDKFLKLSNWEEFNNLCNRIYGSATRDLRCFAIEDLSAMIYKQIAKNHEDFQSIIDSLKKKKLENFEEEFKIYLQEDFLTYINSLSDILIEYSFIFVDISSVSLYPDYYFRKRKFILSVMNKDLRYLDLDENLHEISTDMFFDYFLIIALNYRHVKEQWQYASLYFWDMQEQLELSNLCRLTVMRCNALEGSKDSYLLQELRKYRDYF